MEGFKDKILNYLPTIGITALIVVAGIVVTLLITMILRKAMAKSKLDPSLVTFFIRLVRVLCYSILAIAAGSSHT